MSVHIQAPASPHSRIGFQAEMQPTAGQQAGPAPALRCRQLLCLPCQQDSSSTGQTDVPHCVPRGRQFPRLGSAPIIPVTASLLWGFLGVSPLQSTPLQPCAVSCLIPVTAFCSRPCCSPILHIGKLSLTKGSDFPKVPQLAPKPS